MGFATDGYYAHQSWNPSSDADSMFQQLISFIFFKAVLAMQPYQERRVHRADNRKGEKVLNRAISSEFFMLKRKT